MIKKLKRFSALHLWSTSVLLFLAGTSILFFIDYAADKYLGFVLSRTKNVFYSLPYIVSFFIIFLLSGAILISSAIKNYTLNKKCQSVLWDTVYVLLTATISFAAFITFSFWYEYYFMGRSM